MRLPWSRRDRKKKMAANAIAPIKNPAASASVPSRLPLDFFETVATLVAAGALVDAETAAVLAETGVFAGGFVSVLSTFGAGGFVAGTELVSVAAGFAGATGGFVSAN